MNAPVLPPQGQPVAPPQMPDVMPSIATPAPQIAPVTHDVTIVTTKKLAQAKVLGVPPEEFGIERSARDIKTCNYAFHEVVTKTETQLIEEGFDEEQVKSLNDYTGNTDIETMARDTVQEHTGSTGVNSAARLVKVTEHYVRMDYEGKGRACLYMVVTGGDQGEILRKDGKEVIEPIDVIPFATTTPVPITHRFFGRSMADLVMDIQKIKTSLLRSGLDSKYLAAGADVEVSEAHCSPNTIDDLLGPKRPGRIIRTKTEGGLNYQVVPDTSESAFQGMAYLDGLMETRTGLTKQSQGLDANALQNQSATAVAQVFNASQMRMKLIARIMAEGVRDIFSLLHHTIRSHGQEQQTVRLRNTWKTVDPRNWKTRNDMTINVGLGTGGKAQQFAQMMAIANVQKEMLAGGKANLVGDQELFNSASELAKIMGHKNADKFFNDPSAKDPQTGQLLHPPIPPPPQPEQIKAQATMQVEQMKGQIKQQENQAKSQQDAEKAQLDAYHQKVKMESEMQLAREKADLDAKLALLEAQLKERADARAHEAHTQQMGHKQQMHEHAMKQGVLGMVATAHTHDTKMEQSTQSHEAKMKEAKNKPKGGK